AGQADAVGAGALNAEPDQATGGPDERQAERQQFLEPGDGGGNGDVAESAAEAVDRDSDVVVLVGVDTDDDIVAAKLHAGHRAMGSSLALPGGAVHGSAGRSGPTGLR